MATLPLVTGLITSEVTVSQVIESHAVEADGDYVSTAEFSAEETVVGSLVSSPRARNELRGRDITPLLVHHRHRAVVAAVWSAEQRGLLDHEHSGSVNVPALLGELERAHGPVPAETSGLLWRLPEVAALSPGDLGAAVDLLREGYARRAQVAAGQRLQALGQRPGRTLEEIRSESTAALEELQAATAASADDGSTAADADWAAFVDSLAAKASAPRARFGLVDLDRQVRVEPGHLLTVAARTSIGKTVTSLTMARRAAEDGCRVLYLSFEVGRDELLERVAAAAASVRYDRVRDGNLTNEEIAQLKCAPIPSDLHVPDAPSHRLPDVVAAIHANAAAARAAGQTAITVVDYTQQVTPTRSLPNRQEQVAEVSAELRAAAQQSGSVVLSVAQLNRAADARDDHRPQLTDLRESGALEQDSNAVLLLHRPDFYEPSKRPGEMDLIIAKNRSGQTGMVTVASQLHYQRVVDMARE